MKPYKAIKPMFARNRWRIFPGDMVYIARGPHAQETGRVLQVIKDNRVPQVIVEGVNLRKKKIPHGSKEDEFFVITTEAPIPYSQVGLLEPVPDSKDAGSVPVKPPSERVVRAKFSYLSDGTRVRVGRHKKNATGAIIPIPPTPEDKSSKLGQGGPKDSPATEVVLSTYKEGADAFKAFLDPQGFAAGGTTGPSATRPYSSWARSSATQLQARGPAAPGRSPSPPPCAAYQGTPSSATTASAVGPGTPGTGAPPDCGRASAERPRGLRAGLRRRIQSDTNMTVGCSRDN